jgi:hypothetical protein
MGNFNLKNTQFFDIKGKMGVVSHICIYKINTLSLGTDRLRKFSKFFFDSVHVPRGELSMGRVIREAKCPWGEMSLGLIVCGANFPCGEMSVGQNVRVVKCPCGEVSMGQNVRGARCRGASCRGASCPGANCLGASGPGTVRTVVQAVKYWGEHCYTVDSPVQARIRHRKS